MFLFYNFEIERIVYAVAEKRGESRRDKCNLKIMKNKENEKSMSGTTESNSSEKVDDPVEGLETEETNPWIGKNEPNIQSEIV